MPAREEEQVKADDEGKSERTTEVSIYVVKKTRPGDGEDSVTYSVGVNGRTHLTDGSHATAVERIEEILREME